MLKPLCLAVSLLLVSPLGTAEVFKCNKYGGRTVYQNFPCEIDSIGSEATQPPPAAPAVPSAPVAAPRKAETVAVAANPAAPADGPLHGMTAAEVRASSWGEPWNIIKTGDPKGVEDIWYYGEGRTVTFNRKGVVGSVTQSP